MFFCDQHANGGMTSAGSDCPQCKRGTNSCFQLCTGCAVRKEVCAICLKPVVGVKLTKRLKEAVGTAERRFDRAMRTADSTLAETLSPFAAEAAAYQLAQDRSNQSYEAFIKPLQEKQQAAQQNVSQVRSQGGDIVAAQQAANDAMTALQAGITEGNRIRLEQFAPAQEAFKPYIERWSHAHIAHNDVERHAAGILELRFEQLFGHVNVDRNYRRRLKMFANR